VGVSSAAIIARHWIESRGRGPDCIIMMRITFLVPLHFVLEMQIVLDHSSSFWRCILAHDVAALSTHLPLFCTLGLLSARRFCKDGLQRCCKDMNCDRGVTAEIWNSWQDLRHLAVIANSRQSKSPFPDVVPPNPTMLILGTSTVSRVVFCSRKCPEMVDRGLGFRVSVAIHIA
jgi:hypothetical protein